MGVFNLFANGISADIVVERDCPEGVKRVAGVVADDIEMIRSAVSGSHEKLETVQG